MGLQLKALIVIISLSLLVFWYARRPLTEFSIDPEAFDRRRNLWIALTVFAFVANDFWIYVVGTVLLLAFAAARETNKLAMAFLLVMVIPPFEKVLPGFGGIETILSFSQLRVVSVVLLLPLWLSLRRDPQALPFGRSWADKLLILYIAEPLFLQASDYSTTNTLRAVIYSFVDIFLPYYAASRGLRHLRDYRDALGTWVLAVILLAPIALFEYTRHWLLYSELARALNVPDKMTSYMLRGDSLRAVSAAGHPIILGYVMMVALGFFTFVRGLIGSRLTRTIGLALLIATLAASVARGPWVGSAAVLAVVLLTGPKKFTRILMAAMIALLLFAGISIAGLGHGLLEVLPFVGTADTGSIDYRQRLFDISLLVIRQNLWFGSFTFMGNPLMQELVQGEGIIDLVNSFLAIALTYGMVGLILFVGIFAVGAWNVWGVMRRADPDSEVYLLGRALLASLAGVMVTIATVSSIGMVPFVYWILAGSCVGYAKLAAETQAQATDGPLLRVQVHV